MATHTKHRTKNDFYDDITKIKQALANTAMHMRDNTSDKIQGTLDNAKEKSIDLKDTFEDYVTEKPIKALGIAVLSGLFLGYLLKKGKRHSARHR